MDEFDYIASTTGLPQGDFDLVKAMSMATVHFSDCPKFMTLARHTSLQDKTLLHCEMKGGKNLDLKVPEQDFRLQLSDKGRFSEVRVITPDGENHWLIVCEHNRKGFLIPYEIFETVE